ncbi:class I SAM-dependent methyltransferase [Neolewinella antarctica]|uniref:SAM-dependent methyltransferase n=1 Tax=Neolewinella antarctica TaxID=442734 RepID=A0ABX0XGX2_9BACT|nr:class I SAM-dependent methyltransferase [Neolewinella antarctica]NJC28159.1 SAM-dependent methyltransferase [Neolewinella antarctica]
MDYPLISPTNGNVLREDGAHFLTDGERRWPVVDGIPFLRPDDDLRLAVVADLENGNERDALCRLLADQDRFSPTLPPERAAIERVIDKKGLNLREAMALLSYGPVGDYFAYRWCSPTFTGGLHMLERTPAHQAVVEVACGIGHFLRALEQAGREVVGVDIVYSKLWLARRILGVKGPLICGDVEAGPVIGTSRPTTVFCHDAFYFFEFKEAALTHLRQIAAGGSVAVGHVHTRTSAHEAGFALERAAYGKLTDAFVRDDADFMLGWYGKRAVVGDPASVAVGWIEGETEHRAIEWIKNNDSLRKNPLLQERKISWPSAGWRQEYEEDSQCLNGESLPELINAEWPADVLTRYQKRLLINLPGSW